MNEARLREAARNAINEACPTHADDWFQLMLNFAAAVASEERERCVRLVKEIAGPVYIAQRIANAIRSDQ